MKKRFSILLACTFCISSFISSCIFPTFQGNQENPITKTGFYFDTVISITLYDDSYEKELEECFEMADQYEKLLSNTIPDSDISKINAAEGNPVTVSDDTIQILETALHYSEETDGKFDITIGALSNLWDFSNNSGNIPSQTDIEAALQTVDYHNILISGNTVCLSNPNSILDLGGIAKGFIADKMKAYLNEQGITEGIINLGGNVLTIGPKNSGKPYQVGIQKPFAEDGTAICALAIQDASLVSSGVYQRYFYKDNVLYHHLLDSSTGYPIQNNLLGVTIITDSSMDADALSTSCFALGLDLGMNYIESLDHVEAIFITDDEELHYSSGAKAYLSQTTEGN